MNKEEIEKKEFFKLQIVFSRADLTCTIKFSIKGQVAAKKFNVHDQKLFFPDYIYIHFF